jgi:internalin A
MPYAKRKCYSGDNPMRRLLALCLVCLIVALPLHAQDDEPTPYEIALQRIEEARVTGATELNLCCLGLTEIPPEIGDLQGLEYLALHLNHLSSIDFSLVNLTSLSRYLDLSSNELTSLPSEIGNLVNLQELNLNNNQLTTLPPEIGNLGNLESLSLGYNAINRLPPEFGNLANLEWLGLFNNQLSALPTEIGNLRNLQMLNLNDNQLIHLPTEVGNLHNLEVLSVANNQLNGLPPEVGNLINLCILDLANNHLQSLPPSLGNIHKLEEHIECYGEIGDVYIEDNPLNSPPPEVVEQGTAAILAYLRNQAWYHTQRLILGAAGGIGLVVLLLLGFRWKQRGGRKSKPKREMNS